MTVGAVPAPAVPNLGIGEVLTAVVGLEKLLAGPRPLTLDEQQRARAYPDKLRRAVHRALVSDLAEPVPAEKFDFTETNRLLSSADKAQSQKILDSYPPDVGPVVVETVGRILDLLHAALPRTVTPSLVGGDISRGTPSATRSFRVLWRVARDPLAPLADLEAGHLTPETVTALETLYPSLYALTVSAATAGLTQVAAERPRWRPGSRKTQQVRTLLQQDVSGGLGSVMTAIYQDERQKAAQASPQRQLAPSAGETSSPGQSVG